MADLKEYPWREEPLANMASPPFTCPRCSHVVGKGDNYEVFTVGIIQIKNSGGPEIPHVTCPKCGVCMRCWDPEEI